MEHENWICDDCGNDEAEEMHRIRPIKTGKIKYVCEDCMCKVENNPYNTY